MKDVPRGGELRLVGNYSNM